MSEEREIGKIEALGNWARKVEEMLRIKRDEE